MTTGIGTAPELPDAANAHIDVPRLSELLRGRLDAAERTAGGPVNLEPLGRLKEGPDSTTKAMIRGPGGRPVAVIVCSRPISAGLMERGVVLAEQVRARIGEQLGAAIIRPIDHGYVDGRSYVVLPWYQTLSSSRVVSAWQRRRLRRPILDWLHAATAAAAANQSNPGETYDDVLEHFAHQPCLSYEEKFAIDAARQRLADRAWAPRYTFDHNDLWHGNVLLTGAPIRAGAPLPFVLIDWAGANPNGFGIYDLIRFARTAKLSPQALAQELSRHAEALGSSLADTEGHLLATCGRLHRHLEYFPEDRFLHTFRACRRALKEALAVSETPG